MDIKKIIQEESIKIYFQVILSPMEASSFSVESFVRGVDIDTGEIISPYHLFLAAKEENLTEELDKLCIEKSFVTFKPILRENPKATIYININIDFFKEALSSMFITSCAKKHSIPTNRITLDISNLSMDSNQLDLTNDFIEYHREQGFYISIDDIGKNYSNIDKIMLFNPDIIKLNHQLLNKLTEVKYKNRMINSIIDIAHKMGILVISTGVESQKDINDAMDSGAQMLQGYYVSDTKEYTYDEINKIITDFDRSIVFDIIDAQYQGDDRTAIANVVSFIGKIRGHIDQIDSSDLTEYATAVLGKYPFIESGFILNDQGIQCSQSYVNMENFENRNKELFGLYDQGAVFEKEEFFRVIQDTILTEWVTRPYRSKLSNKVIVTASFKTKIDSDEVQTIVMNLDINGVNEFSAKKSEKHTIVFN